MSDDPFAEFEVDPEELRKQQWGVTGETAIRANGQTEWPEPQPLTAPRELEQPYPVDALPPILRDAVLEYSFYGQQPVPMIASSALASTLLCTQGLADVARDEHSTGPISLYFLTVAVSGERKTSVDRWFKSAPLAWMLERCDAMQPEVDIAEAASASWEAERGGLLAKIKPASGKADIKNGLSVEQLRVALAALEQAKPAKVIVPRFFYEDVNNPTLAADLAEDWPSASLWSDEGGLIVGGHGMADDQAISFLGLLNRLWDGNPFNRDRSTTRRARIRGRRFTVSLMAQPIVMERLLNLAGGASRGMGFIARFLIAWPTSKIGQRPYQEPVDDMRAIGRLRALLRELLDLPLPFDPETPSIMALAPPALRFTVEAQQLWRAFHDDVESELGATGEYADVSDIGAKVAENAARLAASFHVLEHGPTGEIDAETTCRANKIVLWHIDDARRVLTAFDRSQSIGDAVLLLEWSRRQPITDPVTPIDPRRVLRVGPRPLRDVKRRNAAIALLVEYHHWLPCGVIGMTQRYLLNPRSQAEGTA
jgi:hypothetical protein